MRFVFLSVLVLSGVGADGETHSFLPQKTRDFADGVIPNSQALSTCFTGRPSYSGAGGGYPTPSAPTAPPASNSGSGEGKKPEEAGTSGRPLPEPSGHGAAAEAQPSPPPSRKPSRPRIDDDVSDDGPSGAASGSSGSSVTHIDTGAEALPRPVTRPLTETDHQMAAFFKSQKCVDCHGTKPTAGQLFDAEGHALSPGRILDLFEGKTPIPSSMRGILANTKKHLEDKAHAGDREIFEAWAKENGRTLRFGEAPPPLREGHHPARPTAEASAAPMKPGAVPDSMDEAIRAGLISFNDLLEPERFKEKMKRANKPPVFNIGSLKNFLIKDSVMIGPLAGDLASDANEAKSRLDKLTSLATDKEKEIIIYCGCCEVSSCPNVLGAIAKLREAGYKRIKVLNIPVYDYSPEWTKKTGLELIAS